MIRTLVASICLLFLMCSCSPESKIDHQALFEVSDIQLQNEVYIVVVPQNGCSVCVKKAYDFIYQYYDNEFVKILFTNYSTQKAVRIRLKVFGLEDVSRIGFIKNDISKEFGLSSLYPSLIKLSPNGTSNITIMNADDSSDWKELIEAL